MMRMRTDRSRRADCRGALGELSPEVVTRRSKIPRLVAKRRNPIFDFPEKKNGLQSLATRRNYPLAIFSAVLYQLSYLATGNCARRCTLSCTQKRVKIPPPQRGRPPISLRQAVTAPPRVVALQRADRAGDADPAP